MKGPLLALVLALGAPLTAEADESGVHLTGGSAHLLIISSVVGAGAGLLGWLVPELNNPQPLDQSGMLGVGVGFVALFVGMGMLLGQLDPSPPMAWHSLFAGAAGAGFALGLSLWGSRAPPFYTVFLAMAGGYWGGVLLDLIIPGRQTYSWPEFGVSALIAVAPWTVMLFVASTAGTRSDGFTVALFTFPLVALIASRALFAALQPFEPWHDDAQGPQVAPFLGPTAHGAMAGFSGSF